MSRCPGHLTAFRKVLIYHRCIDNLRKRSEAMMRKLRDFDAEMKALENKAKELKVRKVQQLGELVIATGANALTAHELAGALVATAENKEAGRKEAWAKRGVARFQSKSRRLARGSDGNGGGSPTQPGGAQSPSGATGAA